MLKYNVGDLVEIVAQEHGHDFKIGDTVEITEKCGDGEDWEHYGAKLPNG